MVGSGVWAKKVSQILEQSSLSLRVERFEARSLIQNIDELNFENTIIWLATRPNLQLALTKELSDCPAMILLDKPLVSDSMSLTSISELKLQSRSKFNSVQVWRNSSLWKKSSTYFRKLHSIQIERKYVDSRQYISPVLDWLPHDFSLLSDLCIRPSDISIDSLDLETGAKFNLKANLPNGVLLDISISKGDKRNSRWKLAYESGYLRTVDFDSRTATLSDFRGSINEKWIQPSTEHPIENVVTGIGKWGDSDFENQLEYYKWYFEHGGI